MMGISRGCWFVMFSIVVCCTCDGENIVPPIGVHPDHRFFLRQIFDKYGDKGIITFEGFEHLLESLGLGRLSFEKKHNVSMHRVNGFFQDVHDVLHLHDHHHNVSDSENTEFYQNTDVSSQEVAHFSRADEVFAKAGDFPSDKPPSQSTSTIVKRNVVEDAHRIIPVMQPDDGSCMSAQALLHTFGLRPNHSVAIKPSRFLHLCPAIVYQLDRRACSVNVAPIHETSKIFRQRVVQSEIWLYAILATAFISSVGLLAVFMVKLTRRKSFLHFLVSLAVGTLSGDALLHLLPHALLSEDIDHGAAALKCSATLTAIMFFYGLETLLLLVKSSRQKNVPSSDKNETSLELRPTCSPKSVSENVDEEGATMLTSHNHSHGLPDTKSASLALLVLVGDGLHNFTDGLAIGASFATDPVAGLATTIAVFCHELPHELGDFAVLINSGMSVKRALLYNLLSSALSFIGAAAGVWLGEFQNVTQWIYAATAGTFLYIALADLVPEMMSYVRADGKLQGILIQLSGITAGGSLMLVIAVYEEKLYEFLV